MNTIQQAHILLVDDNTDLLRLLEEQLRGAGYQNIRTVQNCAAAQTAFAAEMPELMILDINLPDGDGFSLFRILRAKADVPTLFLSARDADADRLFGLGLGADDYLTKPFLMQELLLRVQHLLQRAYRTELSRTKAAILQLGDRSVDLHLTSKLEYGTQPLRKQEFAAGPLFRELVAQFCESPQAESCEVSLQQTAAAEQAKLCVDRALLERLLENLLGNSIRHNSAPVEIEVQTNVAGNRFCLTVADNGTGYPPAVLAALQGMPQNEQTPHILGLHVVEQIAAAHGGRVTFGQNVPNGAKATVWLPCAEKKAPVAFGQNVVK